MCRIIAHMTAAKSDANRASSVLSSVHIASLIPTGDAWLNQQVVQDDGYMAQSILPGIWVYQFCNVVNLLPLS